MHKTHHHYISGIYNDDHALYEAAKKITGKGFRVKNVWSPFPVHGIDEVIGVPRTRMAICSFIYAVTGCALAVLMMHYMQVLDWPANIGGKPNFYLYTNIPAFIPIVFESTVLCAAHGMVITFLLRSWLLPGVTASNPVPGTTDSSFVMQVEAEESKIGEVRSLLKETGAEIKE